MSVRGLRAQGIVLDIFDLLHRMTPQWMMTQDHAASQASRHRWPERSSERGTESCVSKPATAIVQGNRSKISGAATGGIDSRRLWSWPGCPPGFRAVGGRSVRGRREIGQGFVGFFFGIFVSHAAGVFGVLFREGGRRVESRRFASWCETLWHDALSDVVPMSANGESFSIGPWNCCVTCRASPW